MSFDFTRDEKKILREIIMESQNYLHTNILRIYCQEGNIEGVKWLKELNIPLHEAIDFAVDTGQRALIAWILKEGFTWKADDMIEPVRAGNNDFVKWMWEHGCPWRKDIMIYAASSGNIGLIKWMWEHGCPWDEDVVWFVTDGKYSQLVNWLRSINPSPQNGDRVVPN